MSDNKKMIHFYSLLLIISTLLTYLVDINGQLHFFSLNTPWISNDFCFAILSGIVTGLIVALAAEIRFYWLHKRQAQKTMYSAALELYKLISMQKATLYYYIHHPDAVIPESIDGESRQQLIQKHVDCLNWVDYSVFAKKDPVLVSYNSFRNQIAAIERTARGLIKLRIAYNETELEFLKNNANRSPVTSSSPHMSNALQEHYCSLQDCLPSIENFCSSFEKLNKKQYFWTISKAIIDEVCEKIESDPHYSPN